MQTYYGPCRQTLSGSDAEAAVLGAEEVEGEAVFGGADLHLWACSYAFRGSNAPPDTRR